MVTVEKIAFDQVEREREIRVMLPYTGVTTRNQPPSHCPVLPPLENPHLKLLSELQVDAVHLGNGDVVIFPFLLAQQLVPKVKKNKGPNILIYVTGNSSLCMQGAAISRIQRRTSRSEEL